MSQTSRRGFMLAAGTGAASSAFGGPQSRPAVAGNASCSALSSCRQTTSGSARASQASRLSSRLLMLLMLNVAIFTVYWILTCFRSFSSSAQKDSIKSVSGSSSRLNLRDTGLVNVSGSSSVS